MKKNITRLFILISCLTLSNCLITSVCAASDTETGYLHPSTVVTSSNWDDPVNTTVYDSYFARSNQQANYIILGDFGLRTYIAGGQINGIIVSFRAKIQAGYGTMVLTCNLSWDGGSTWTASKETAGIATQTVSFFSVGGSTDKWGRPSWALSDFDDGKFLTNVSSKNNDGTEYGYVEVVEVNVFGSGFLPEFNNIFIVPLFALIAVLPLFLSKLKRRSR
ncbi:MAG: hypothetical protein ACXAEU_18980 [Candidatus Hodarchaeales archaeon]